MISSNLYRKCINSFTPLVFVNYFSIFAQEFKVCESLSLECYNINRLYGFFESNISW